MSFLFGKRKSINVFRPRDKRFQPMTIKTETDIALNCPKKDGVNWRFYKSGPGWTGPGGEVMFLGVEGTAHTAILKDDAEKKCTLPEALRALWGDAAYDKLDATLLDVVEKHKFGVTIDPEKIPISDKESALSAANIDDENDKKAMDQLANAMKDKGKMDWRTFLQGGAVVGFVVYILANLHILPVIV